MKRSLITLLFLCFALGTNAQVIIQFIPEVSGRSVDGLFQCRITNPGKTQNAVLTITVSERTKGTVCIVKTPSFTLIQGTSTLPFTAARNAGVQYAANNLGQLTRINRQFPEGDYDYCFNIKLAQSDLPEEQCFSYLLAPFSNLSLIEPGNQDKICDTRPLFSWQPLLPGLAGSYYQLVVAEVRTDQNPTEALNYNLPVINQSGIISPILPYPAVNRELEKGKKYAWQVTVYKDQTILTRSEIWSFTLDCQDSPTAPEAPVSYRTLTDLLKGNNYIALGKLKFALSNPYAEQTLTYEITPLDEPAKKIRRLPKIKLKTGDNRIIIDLEDNGAFKDGQYYMIQVWYGDHMTQKLRFQYEQPQ